jgi:hypothetical protein
MPFLRKILFYIFVLLYLVICPLIILRMLGIVLDPKSFHWVKTGIIYASSNPPGATIYLDGKKSPEVTPAVIRDLWPKQYHLRMELDGYKSWENDVPVVDKKATSVENILLIPSEWKIKNLSSSPITKIVPMPGNAFLLFSIDDLVKGLHVLRLNRDIENDNDTKSIEAKPLFPEESIYRNAKVLRYFTVEKSPFLVLHIYTGEREKYLWVDLRDKQLHLEDISDLLPQPPDKLLWEANDEHNIFAFYRDVTNRINIKEKAIYPNIQDKDLPTVKKQEKNITLPVEADQFFLVNNDNSILFRRGNQVFLIDEETFGQPRLTKVLTVKPGSDISFAEKTGKMYFIDHRNSFLSSVQILHHRAFIPKPVAETLRLKRLD